MLTNKEKDRLKNQAALTKNERAKLYFHVGRKIKNRLSELEEINDALCALPDRNARRILDDDRVNAIFKLTENMLRILDFSNIIRDFEGLPYVTRTEPKQSKDGKTKFEVIRDLANSKDMARQLLMDDHLFLIKYLMISGQIIPFSEPPDSVVYLLSNGTAVIAAMKQMHKWGRPTKRTVIKEGSE
jgi:hypothetical protein